MAVASGAAAITYTIQALAANGGASIFTFEIKGGKEAAWKFIDNLEKGFEAI
ncbi:hypothetical protein SAMN04487928_105101 [Butyrivibrio proteoclasticus]|uniref:Uncharacterized protein n=1 Tax=Butyrivibrio proteoclasticus TaxID=43305 RepID=A0A1I5S318_9FIRM|nr:hypothetical protein [Butyrivibrio proteoclasticus]SFP65178.1 hypothetical protein SAMN04487928_105101 [Butyrivibrio proteoclasticus]